MTNLSKDGENWAYSYSDNGNIRTTTVPDPLSNQRVVSSEIDKTLIRSIRNPLNRTTSYDYDANGRLTKTTAPEGNNVQYAYDARGNVTQMRSVAKPGSGQADIVTSAAFEAGCSNPKTCNQPVSSTDARSDKY